MDFSSFLTSLGTSFMVFLVLMFLFSRFSRQPSNHGVYYPNWLPKGLDPYVGTRVTRNPFAWIKEAVYSTEADVIRLSGVDAAVYFVYLSTATTILLLSGVILLPMLLPVVCTVPFYTYNDHATTSEGTYEELDKLSIGRVKGSDSRLWAFLVATYWVSFVSYYLLWKAYKHVSNLRVEALMSPEVKNEQFVVLVRDIPPPPHGQTIKEQVDSYFKTIYPETFYRSMVVTDNKQVKKIHEELEGYRKKLVHAEASYEQSKGMNNPEGRRPTCKTGFMGVIGKKVDAIDYYDEKIRELLPKLEFEQKVTLKDKQQHAALIFFNNRVTAAAASQSLHNTMVDKWTTVGAPEARQLLWTNLSKNYYQRLIRRHVVYFIVFLTIFCYIIPIGTISALSTLDKLRKLLPSLEPILDRAAARTVLGAYSPQLALTIILELLSRFLLFLSKAEGIPSVSHAERAASGKYFYFTVLNVFIGVTLVYPLFGLIRKVENNPSPQILGKGVEGGATFFFTFVALKFFVGYGLELSRIIPLMIFHLKRKYVCKNEAELKKAWAPGDLHYNTRFPDDMLILTIVICYSVIAPLILPFGVLYFGLGWLVLRNQALKVYVPKYESYGLMWPHMYNRIMAALALYQFIMLGYFWVRKLFYAWVLVPLPILTSLFIYICTKKYHTLFQSTALDVACCELKETPDLESVFRSYIPACLRSEKGDEDALSYPASSMV